MKLIPMLPARFAQVLGTTVFMGTVLATSSGCGALGAMANPKVAWAIQDPAPMTVVVRRADAAAATSKEIDRLLTSTPANSDSDWMGKVAPSSDDTKANLKALGDMPMYKTSKARVVPSEVWVKTLPNVRSDNGQYPNLLAAVDTTLGDSYAKIMAKKQEIADLKAQIATEDEAASAKGVSDADKQAHQKTIDDLKKQKDKAEDDVGPLQKDFLKAAKDDAQKASPDVKAKFGTAFVNLRQAADDADIANGAAAVRYPLAAPGLKDALMQVVQVSICDIVEEKTGHRPVLSGGFKPGISLDGGTVSLTLNGLTSSDLGSLSIGDVTTETVKRTQGWLGHALGLLGDISKTKEILSFEEDVLDAVVDGFKAGGWAPPAAAKIDSSAQALAAAASFVPPVTATVTTSATVSASGSASASANGAAQAKGKATKKKAKKAPAPAAASN
jgi:hypothetical protein